jgi:hypothetical protein
MENDINTPYSYTKWLSYQNNLIPENSQEEYLRYIKNWYFKKSSEKGILKKTVKEDYIQLLKDLKFLFGQSEMDAFLKELDFNNDEELIYTIPFFAKKLKQIALIFSKKRESVKQAKLKYNLIGSNSGLEKLLYEYILKGFSKSSNNITQVPTSKFSSFFPELSNIKNDFYIEIEELHDKNVYLGSDSSVPIKQYVDVDQLKNNTISKEFIGLSETDILNLISTQFLTKISNSFLSNVFLDFLTYEIPTLTSTDLFNSRVLNVYNQIEASKKYLSEPLYGLTAIKLKDISEYDNFLSLNFSNGNNWFYWPSGVRNINEEIFNNIFAEIPINDSNLYNSGATATDDYTTSDLIFTDKNGIVEGAWLQGIYTTPPQPTNMKLTLNGGTKKEFIFPFVGIDFSTKTSEFLGYKFNDDDNVLLDSLNPKTKEKLLLEYFSNTLPTSSCYPLYINNTTLISDGAYASTFSDAADVVIKKKRIYSSDAYRDLDNGELESAYLYKFDRTDIPISTGINNIFWPLQKIENKDESISLSVNKNFCLPIKLRDLDVKKTMVGSIAGSDLNSSDIIYKMNDRGFIDISECAWLGAPLISQLDIYKNSITIYDEIATKCSQFIDGPIQSSLSLYVTPTQKQSFIWMDEDTFADDVFKHVEHSPSCPYLKQFPHDYYSDQDYQNTSPINDKKKWKTCNCKSVNYSPIGHSGDNVFDFNGMADYLFADPDGMGEDFAINSWTDTRGFDAYNSPQFSYFNLSKEKNESDINVGWGKGQWKTSNGKKMVLKTGKRYTYYRTSLRSSYIDTPYFVTKYPYKKINGLLKNSDGFDLVIVIDNSKSQSLNLDITKTCVINILDKIFSNKENKNIQVALVEFNAVANRLSYLTNEPDSLKLFTSQIKTTTDPDLQSSHIKDALILAKQLLTETVKTDDSNTTITKSSFNLLCSDLNFLITNTTTLGNNIKNSPQPDKPKKLLIFSDGLNNTGLDINQDIVDSDNEINDYASRIKFFDKIQIYSVGIGKKSYDVDKMEKISSTKSTYFNLENFLYNGDGDLYSFIDYISMRIYGDMPINPMWYKAIRNTFGRWEEAYDDLGNLEISDMELRPGDYISYVHKASISYSNEDNNMIDFNIKGLSFTLNSKLNGWDYNSNTFSEKNIGIEYGAKPYWGKVNVKENQKDNFKKDTILFGGKIKFIDDYLPVQQPEVSNMILSSGDVIEYNRKIYNNIIWNQHIEVYDTIELYKWNKLIFNVEYSNLKDFLFKQQLDGVVYPTNEPSDIVLESYSSFKPALFNYYARNPFTYNQGLYNRKRCLDSFVSYNTGVLIEPTNSFENIINNFQPSIASTPFPYNIVSEKETGMYLLPENLGASFYRGKGYRISLDQNKITTFKAASSEITYFNLEKYGPRQRGLTKKDQLSITKIDEINNKWIFEPYSSAGKAGILINTLENQKLTPYQSTYEIIQKNNYGISRQSDAFQLWNPPIPPTWIDPEKYPLTFRKELPLESYKDKKQTLLVDKGRLCNWNCDVFGNNYGLYKSFKPNNINDIIFWFSAEDGAVKENALSVNYYDTFANNGDYIVRWADKTKRKRDLNAYFGRPRFNLISDNGKPSIVIDGKEALDNMTVPYELDVTELSFFIIAKFNNVVGTKPNVLFSFGESLSSNDLIDYENVGLAISNESNKLRFSYGNVALEERVDLTNENIFLDLNKFHLYEMHYSLPNSYAYVDGELYAETETSSNKKLRNGLYATEGFWIGSYILGNFSSRCEISEIIMYNRKLNNKEIIDIRKYINNLYSIY